MESNSETLKSLRHKSFEFALEEISKILRSRKENLSFAESCTGGLLSATLCEKPGVSNIFLGSVVSYSNEVKVNLLAVKEDTLKSFGAVSVQVAKEMAQGASSRLKTNWAVSITGVAGPGGGSVEKPVGTVCFSIVGPNIELVEKQVFSGQRTDIQRQAADYAAKLLLNQLLKL